MTLGGLLNATMQCGVVINNPEDAYEHAPKMVAAYIGFGLSLSGVIAASMVVLTITFIYPRAASEGRGCGDAFRCKSCDRCCQEEQGTRLHLKRSGGDGNGGKTVFFLWMVYVLAWFNLLSQMVALLSSVVGMSGNFAVKYALGASLDGKGNLQCYGRPKTESMLGCTGAAVVTYLFDQMSFTWSVAIGVIAVVFLMRKRLLSCVSNSCSWVCRATPTNRIVRSRDEEEGEEEVGWKEEEENESQSSFVTQAMWIGVVLCVFISLGSSLGLGLASFTGHETKDPALPEEVDRAILTAGGLCAIARNSPEEGFSTGATVFTALVAIICFVLVGYGAANAIVPKATMDIQGRWCDPKWHRVFFTAMFGSIWRFVPGSCCPDRESDPTTQKTDPTTQKTDPSTQKPDSTTPKTDPSTTAENIVDSPRARTILRSIAPLRFYPLTIMALSIAEAIIMVTVAGTSPTTKRLSIWPPTSRIGSAQWERTENAASSTYHFNTTSLGPRGNYAQKGHVSNFSFFPEPTVALEVWKGCMRGVSFVGVDPEHSIAEYSLGGCAICSSSVNTTLPLSVPTGVRDEYDGGRDFLCRQLLSDLPHDVFLDKRSHKITDLANAAKFLSSTSSSRRLHVSKPTDKTIIDESRIQRDIVISRRVTETAVVWSNSLIFLFCTPAMWDFAARLWNARRAHQDEQERERQLARASEGDSPRSRRIKATRGAPGGQMAGKGELEEILFPARPPCGWNAASGWGVCCTLGVLLPIYTALGCVTRNELQLSPNDRLPTCCHCSTTHSPQTQTNTTYNTTTSTSNPVVFAQSRQRPSSVHSRRSTGAPLPANRSSRVEMSPSNGGSARTRSEEEIAEF